MLCACDLEKSPVLAAVRVEDPKWIWQLAAPQRHLEMLQSVSAGEVATGQYGSVFTLWEDGVGGIEGTITHIKNVPNGRSARLLRIGYDVAQKRFVGDDFLANGFQLQLLPLALRTGIIADEIKTMTLATNGLATITLGLSGATGDTGTWRALLVSLDGRRRQPRDGNLQAVAVVGRGGVESRLGW